MEKKREDDTCCQKIDLAKWDGKEITWKDKLFVRDRVLSIFHIPLNFSTVMSRIVKKAEEAKALGEDSIWLSDENSLFGSDLYLSVTKKISGATMVRISGTFLAKVFEGSYGQMRNWITRMQEFVKSKGRKVKKLYFYYTTCPACVRKLGKNYVVIFAQV